MKCTFSSAQLTDHEILLTLYLLKLINFFLSHESGAFYLFVCCIKLYVELSVNFWEPYGLCLLLVYCIR